MKKGFTLVELLAVIVILAIILAIAIPSVRTFISNSYAESYKLDLKAMEEAAKGYVIDRKIKFEEVDRKIVQISTLIEEGFLDPVIDPQSKGQCEGYVRVDKNYRKYTYKAYLKCGANYESDNYGYTDNVFPEIFILGDNPVTLGIGGTYIDEGATATDNIDEDITNKIITTGSVNPDAVGTYTITYSVTDSSDNTTTVERIINVIDYIPIFNETQLAQVCSDNNVSINGYNYTMSASGKYKLMNDIALTGNWTPICYPFTGVFDGDNHQITNVKMVNVDKAYVGLFEMNSGSGTIKNLNVAGNITYSTSRFTNEKLGLLTAYNTGTIDNCHVSGTVSSSVESATFIKNDGCLVGHNIGTINGSSATCNLTASSGGRIFAGLLIGYNSSAPSLSSNHASGDITISGTVTDDVHAGGLIGYLSNATLINSSYSGTMTFNLSGLNACSFFGGLIGRSTGDTINNSYSTGTMNFNFNTNSACPRIGGFAGNIETTNIDTSHSNMAITGTAIKKVTVGGLIGSSTGTINTVKNSYTTGNIGIVISGSDSPLAGGLIGQSSKINVLNCFSTSNLDIKSVGSVSAGGLIGSAAQNTSIHNCYTRGDVIARTDSINTTQLAGGLIGGTNYNGANSINNSYATGNIYAYGSSVDYSKVGGIVVYNNLNNTANSCFWNTSANMIKYNVQSSVAYASNTGTATYLNGLTSNEMLGTSTPSFTGYGGTTYNNMLTALNAYVSGSGVPGLVTWNRNPSINNGYPYLVGVTPSS